MDQELLSLALKSPPNVMLEAADHLLAAGNAEAAALLYQKGGKLGKALDMAFAAGLYEVLDNIAENLDQDKDPEIMARSGHGMAHGAGWAGACSSRRVAWLYVQPIYTPWLEEWFLCWW